MTENEDITETKSKKPVFYLMLIAIILISIFVRFYSLGSQYLEYDETNCMISGLKFHHESFQAGKAFMSDQPPLGKYTFGIFTAFDKSNDYSVLKYILPNLYALSPLAHQLIKINLVKLRLSAAFLGIFIIILVYILSYLLYKKHSVSLIASALAAISADFIAQSRFIQMSQNALFGSLLALVFYFLFISENKKYHYVFLSLFSLSYIYTLNSKLWPAFLLSAAIGIHFFLFLFFRQSREKRFADKLKGVIISGAEFFIAVIICLALTYFVINPTDAQTYRRASDISIGFSVPYFLASFFVRNSYAVVVFIILAIFIFFMNKEKRKDFFNISNYSKKEYFPLLFVIVSFILCGFTNLSDPYTFRSHFYSYILNTFALMMIGLGYVAYYFISITNQQKNQKNKKLFIGALFIISFSLVLLYFPDRYYEYANFGVSTDYRYGYASVSWHAHPWQEKTLDSLFEEFKDKRIYSYDPQFLVFFPGNVSLYPFNIQDQCNEQVINSIIQNKDNILIIDWKGFQTDQFRRAVFCPAFLDLNFSVYRVIPKSEMVDEQEGYIFKIS